MKQAVILAGGKGTRLRERLGGRPKPLIDLCGKPLLERQILLARRYGFTHVLILVNYAADQIIEYCRSSRNWGLEIECIDDGEPLGTAGATLSVFDRLASEFLVMYGDTMLEVDLARFHEFHRSYPNAAATLLIHPNDHPHDSDLVEVDDDDKVLAFHPYPHDSARFYPNNVNAALYWVSKASLAPWAATPGAMDFGKHLFPEMLASGAVLRGYRSSEYIKDIGTPERLDRVADDFKSGKIERASLAHPQAMIFLDRDGTLNREVDHLQSHEQFELLPGVAPALRRLNHSEYRCCIVTNQPVVARGECSFEGLREIHNKLETLLGQAGAFVDRIYFCPHHPDKGFDGERPELKLDCDCRKPKTGMIDRAVAEFNVARERSWLIGDSSTDIETARRAGVRSVLVETGYAGLDYRHWSPPDFVVEDLPAAVDFLLAKYPRLLDYCAGIAAGIRDGAVVLIGGQSRSGKTTFASALRHAFIAAGRNAVVLAADRWLVNAADRGEGVLTRYDLQRLQGLVDRFEDPRSRPARVCIPGYDKLRRARIENVDEVAMSDSDVIVIEGAVALGLRTLASVQTCRFMIDVDEAVRKKRILREYQMRGLTADAALAIYEQRLVDEFPVVEAFAKDAQHLSPESEAP